MAAMISRPMNTCGMEATLLDQPLKNTLRHQFPQLGVYLEKPGDVSQIFLPLAGAPAGITGGPNLAAENISQTRHGEAVTENLAHLGSRGKFLIPRIDLKLNPQVRIRSGQVHRMLEALHPDRWLEQCPQALDLSAGKGEIEVEAYDRLGIRIDGADRRSRSNGRRPPRGCGASARDEIGVVHGHRSPEGRRLHEKSLCCHYSIQPGGTGARRGRHLARALMPGRRRTLRKRRPGMVVQESVVVPTWGRLYRPGGLCVSVCVSLGSSVSSSTDISTGA